MTISFSKACRAFVDSVVAEEMETVARRAAFLPPADPFKIDNPCEYSADGEHDYIASCMDIVCCNCGKVA